MARVSDATCCYLTAQPEARPIPDVLIDTTGTIVGAFGSLLVGAFTGMPRSGKTR